MKKSRSNSGWLGHCLAQARTEAAASNNRHSGAAATLSVGSQSMSEPSTAPFSKWREVAVFDARVLRSGGEARDRELRRLRQAVER